MCVGSSVSEVDRGRREVGERSALIAGAGLVMTISRRRTVDYEGETIVVTRVSAALPGYLGLLSCL